MPNSSFLSLIAKIFTYSPVKMLLFVLFLFISRPVFAKRENVSSGTVYTRACNLSLHLCVPSTRLLAKCHGQHVVHVYTWLSEKRAKWERNGDGEWRGSAAREPVTSNYTARFIIYCRQFLLPPRRCIRPAIEEWFVRRTRSRIHEVDQWGGTPRVDRPRIAIWVSSSRAAVPLYFFQSSFLFPAKKRA